MDVFSVTVTAVHELHAVITFIKGIVDDVRTYDDDKKDIQIGLNHEVLFFTHFKAMFFDTERGAQFYAKQPEYFRQDCVAIIDKLQNILAEYRLKAMEYGLVESGGDTPASAQPGEKDIWLGRLGVQKVISRLSDLKLKAIHWSIFDKSRISKLLESLRDWTARLRETVSWMLSMRSLDDGFAPDPKALREMGLQEAWKRQENAALSEPPHDFGPMAGFLKGREGVDLSFGPEPQLAIFSEDADDWSDAEEVIVEPRHDGVQSHDPKAIDGESISGQAEDATQMVRRLAWLLCRSTFSQGIEADTPLLLCPKFKGYVVRPEDSRIVFVYEPPTGKNISRGTMTTLYSIINERDVETGKPLAKPTLGNRFFLAWTLSLTVLNIHSSRWVHKDIWSRSILLTSAPNTARPRTERLVPYLTGWGLARREDDDTLKRADFDAVRNLYRHPSRQGQPTVNFRAEHDMYALGVVLIEIALWETIDQIFFVDIARSVPVAPGRLLRWWKKTGKPRVAAELGEGFADAVETCLEWKKGGTWPTEQREAGFLAFRDKIVDVLGTGIDL